MTMETGDDSAEHPGVGPGAAPGADSSPDDIIRALEDEKRRFEDLWLRALADLENYRKRVLREQEERERRAAERILLALLETQDDMEKALESGRDLAGNGESPLASFYRGIELIHRQLGALLAREGVRPIDSAGVPFDPRLHEASARVDPGNHESDTVVDVIQKGYLLGDRLLRPARVTVAR